jgi:hypothetical protein
MTKAKLLTTFIVVACFGVIPALSSTESPVSDGCKVAIGYINKYGKFAIKPRFGQVLDFSDGLAWTTAIEDFNQKQVIAKSGTVRFSMATPYWPGDFHSGMAKIRNGSQYGYVNERGEATIPCQYLSASAFHNGVATVTADNSQAMTIDVNGVMVQKPVPVPEPPEPNEIKQHGKVVEGENGRLVFIPTQPNGKNERQSHFSEGLAWVQLSSTSEHEQLAYIDEEYRVLFKLGSDVEMVGDFHEGLAPVLVTKTGVDELGRPTIHRLGFIDNTGKLVIPAKFVPDDLDNVHFSEGMARIKVDATTCCYINKKGNSIGPFFCGGDFHDGLAKASALIDAQGKMIDPNDLSYGYQTRTSYELALRTALQIPLASLKSERQIDFMVNPAEENISDVSITKGSGDVALDKELISIVKQVTPPKRGLLLPRSSPFTFVLLNGNLSVGFTRFPRQNSHPIGREDL